MGNAMFPLGLVETIPVEDDLCTRLGFVEDLGGFARFVLVKDETIYETGERICNIKRKIILPYDAILPGIEMAGRFIAARTATHIGNVVKLFGPR